MARPCSAALRNQQRRFAVIAAYALARGLSRSPGVLGADVALFRRLAEKLGRALLAFFDAFAVQGQAAQHIERFGIALVGQGFEQSHGLAVIRLFNGGLGIAQVARLVGQSCGYQEGQSRRRPGSRAARWPGGKTGNSGKIAS